MTMRRLSTVAVSLLITFAAMADVPVWVRQAIPPTMPESTKTADAVVLLDERVLTVAAAGEINTRHRRVVKIQTNAGRDYGYASVAFDKETKLQSLRGWSIDAKGTQYEVKERDAVETSPFDGELYSDTRVKVLRIPATDPGSVIAFEYTQRERPYLLQTVWHFQEAIPVLRARLQVDMPQGWTQEAHWSNYQPVAPMQGAWELRDIPAIKDEPRMPDAASLAGRAAVIFVSPTGGTRVWGDVATFFERLATVRAATTPEIQAKVRELSKPGASSESIRALARFAQRDVRYVAIEIGIGGYQPHAAGDVLRNRYGD